MQIHATNINGLGASQVVISFLDAYVVKKDFNQVTIYLPSNGVLANYFPEKGTLKRFNRKLPNAISRLFECLFSRFYFPDLPTIVLGDIPLRGIRNQVVLVHQPNLIKPSINSFSSNTIKFKINRFLFKINHKYAKKIIVQTGAMAKDLIASYPSIEGKVIISPQPTPSWLSLHTKVKTYNGNKTILFYPAAFYPHKKHEFLIDFSVYCENNDVDVSRFEIWLTLSDKEYEPFKDVVFVRNLGRLNSDQMNRCYEKVDSLLFLSSMESYGLPLVESLKINLPIVVVKFDYSTWLCEDCAYYFQPYDEKSLLIAIDCLIKDMKENKIFNYDSILKKFPETWRDVVNVFEESLIK
jgi:glycosyltransferase involved in cell wall biosynthesis